MFSLVGEERREDLVSVRVQNRMTLVGIGVEGARRELRCHVFGHRHGGEFVLLAVPQMDVFLDGGQVESPGANLEAMLVQRYFGALPDPVRSRPDALGGAGLSGLAAREPAT